MKRKLLTTIILIMLATAFLGIFVKIEPANATATHLYVGLATVGWEANYRVTKVDLSTFTKVSTLTLSPTTDETPDKWVTGLVTKNETLYAILDDFPNFVTKIDLDTFTEVANLTLNSGDDEAWLPAPAVIVGDYLYITCGSAGRLLKIDLNTFTRVGALSYAGSTLWSIATDETYLYTGDYAAFPGDIFKVGISDFSKVGTLTLSSGENYLRSMVVDEEKSFLYTTHFLSPARVVKVDLSTYTNVSALTLDTGENEAVSTIIEGNNLYVGLYTSPGKIVKIDLTTFTKVSTLTFATGENKVDSFEIVGNYLYAGLATYPAKIVKVDLTTFDEISTLTLDSGEDRALCLKGYSAPEISPITVSIVKPENITYTSSTIPVEITATDGTIENIVNGGFETGDFTGWGNDTVEISIERVRTGSYACWLHALGWVVQPPEWEGLNVSVDSLSYFGFYYLLQGNETEALLRAQIGYVEGGETIAEENVTDKEEWFFLDIIPSLTVGKTISYISIFTVWGNLYIDDVSLMATPPITVWYNCKNGTEWIYGSNQTYTTPTNMMGFVNGTYEFYAWANNTEGGFGSDQVWFTVEISPTEYLVNVYTSPSGVGSVGFTIDGASHSTPYNENLTIGSHTFIRSQATKTVSSTIIYGFEKWMVTNSSGTFNFTNASITLDIQTATNLTLVYSTIQINIASSPEIHAGFKVDGVYSFTTSQTIYRNKGSHTFLCTTFQYYPNASYVYTFDHWTVNGSGNYASLSLTLNFQDDTDLTMVYVGSPVSPPFPYIYARGALNATWYMRSDTHTIHAQLGFKLLTENTHTPTFDERMGEGTLNITYGVRVWAIDIFGHLRELTSGSPVAIVIKSDAGGEMMVAYWNCPAYSSMIDSVMVKVYQAFGSEAWSLRRIFITKTDLLIRLPASTWTFHYYVIRTVGSTNSTFGFGSYTIYNSRIDLQYYKATPWDVALARLWQRDFVKFMFTPWTYWLGDLFWTIILFGCIVMAYLRTGSLKPILGLLWILGGSGSILWALIPATALHVAVLMLAVAMAITYFRLVYK